MESLGRVIFLIGADDDVVLDPKLERRRQQRRRAGGAAAAPTSRWAGMQADAAIVAATLDAFPQLDGTTARTPEELLASEADAVVIISYLTQPSFAWYARFFDALSTLEARGVAVYPSAHFKRLISCKAEYLELLCAHGLPTCPTRVLRRAELVGADGAVDGPLVEAVMHSALEELGLLVPRAGPRGDGPQGGVQGGGRQQSRARGERPAEAAGASTSAVLPSPCVLPGASPAVLPFRLVSKPSNADGGYGVAFWFGGGVPLGGTGVSRGGGGALPSAQSQEPAGSTCIGGEAPAEAAGGSGGETSLAVSLKVDSIGAPRPDAAAELPPAPPPLPLLESLRLGAILTCGCDLPGLRADPPPKPPHKDHPPKGLPPRSRRRAYRSDAAGRVGEAAGRWGGAADKEVEADVSAAASAAPTAVAVASGAVDAHALPLPLPRPLPFLRYLESVGLSDGRPHVLLQPLVAGVARHFELKLYFLKREPFFAALVYGKESVVARVARPDTDATLFAYLAPLLAASRRALDVLPVDGAADGPTDPKILMRVDWCVGAPELPSANAEEGGEGEGGEGEGTGGEGGEDEGPRSLKRALVWRAAGCESPERRLAAAQASHGTAQLAGAAGAERCAEGCAEGYAEPHFIAEVEINPGYYVDWDDTPDRTIKPLARAYGEYLTELLTARKARG